MFNFFRKRKKIKRQFHHRPWLYYPKKINPFRGFRMVLGWRLPPGDTPDKIEKIKKQLILLSTEFGEAQYFATHRVSEFHIWMKAVNGAVTRVYGFADGESFIVEGEPTAFEAGLNLVDTFSEEAKQEDCVYKR